MECTIQFPESLFPLTSGCKMRALGATISGMRQRCRLRSEMGWAYYCLCYFKMVAPSVPCFRRLVKGIEDPGNDIVKCMACTKYMIAEFLLSLTKWMQKFIQHVMINPKPPSPSRNNLSSTPPFCSGPNIMNFFTMSCSGRNPYMVLASFRNPYLQWLY